MKRTAPLLSLALLAGTALIGLGATPAAAAPVPSPPLLHIMPLGDSITEGVGSPGNNLGYRPPLWNLMSGQSRYLPDFVGGRSLGNFADPDNEGHSGWRIDQVQPLIDQWQSTANPDVILLHLGINDLRQTIPPSQDFVTDPVTAANRLSTLLDGIMARKPGVTVIFQGLLTETVEQEQRAATFNSIIRGQEASRQAAGQHFRYAEPPKMDAATDLNPDRLHPTDAGYAKMARVYSDALERAVTDGWTQHAPAPRAGNEVGGAARVRWADWDGDGKADQILVADNGAVSVKLNRGGNSGAGWQNMNQVATGLTTDRTRARFADWDGDGKADYILVNANGSLVVYLNRGGDGRGGWVSAGQVGTGATTNQDQVRFADFDGDGKADYTTIADNGSVVAYVNRGGDTGGGGWQVLNQVASGTTTDRSRVRLADIDGDGRADYITIATNGSVSAYANRGGDGHGGWGSLGQIASGVTTVQSKVQFADFNGDTHADYFLSGTGDSVAVYLFNGFGAGWLNQGTVV
ncbi:MULTISPECIES: FG-GAP-like repeat-containing protein [unclassified Streptomyces]|uniref:FG-GAP-like repeat-containing protein n=1 Tax=unclassified Streptomyces TaxID=2593676 RepID=UPI001F0D904B|nr:FG-GAP-like repeat-containing protein [Streptomyces sp. A1136]